MTIATTILSIALIAFFGMLGGAKLALIPAMVDHVADLGFTIKTCRVIGGLEVAACLGLVLGFFWEPITLVTSLGLVILMLTATRAQLWAGGDRKTVTPTVWLGATALATTVLTALNLAL